MVAEKIASKLNSSDVTIEQIKYSNKLKELWPKQEEIKKGNLSDFEYNDSILDHEPYDLIFFGTPTHGANPAVVFYGYIERVKNIKGKNFIIFNTCRAFAGKILRKMEAEIEKKGGKVVNERIFRNLFKIKLSKVNNFIDELNKAYFNN